MKERAMMQIPFIRDWITNGDPIIVPLQYKEKEEEL